MVLAAYPECQSTSECLPGQFCVVPANPSSTGACALDVVGIQKTKEGELCMNGSITVCDTGLECRKSSPTEHKCLPYAITSSSTTASITTAVPTTSTLAPVTVSSSNVASKSSTTYSSTASSKPTDRIPINNAQSLEMMGALGVISFLFFL